MPIRITIDDLQDIDKVSKMCSEMDEPIFITKDGEDCLVIMSLDVYDKKMSIVELLESLPKIAVKPLFLNMGM